MALSRRGQARTGANPNVGCVIVKAGRVVGRGWTQSGGRPHAEAVALAEAEDAARGGTAYVTLEPCAHVSDRGHSCADLLAASGVARVAVALQDPDPRTNGKGLARLRDVGIATVAGVGEADARQSMAGWLMQQAEGRPFITLKLATSLDGCIALASGESQWITGAAARAHTHIERAHANMILVGRGTYQADAPKLDVRLPGLETRSPARAILTGGTAPADWAALARPEAVRELRDVQYLFVEGGAGAAAAFLKADLVDRLLLYRAPILIGGGKAALGDIGLQQLDSAHGRWKRSDRRSLGSDTLEIYHRQRGAH
jgi:diaminohydroxyphosphoribosylaminopyrimidine deaminase / 5-amino-6-(5-phosphoribosylamino)uracil reductase